MEHSFALVRAAFVQRLEKDSFHDLRLDDEPASIHDFIDCLTVGNVAMRHFGLSEKARFPDLTNLNMTFAQFMLHTVQVEDQRIPIAAMFRANFCKSVATMLVMEVAHEHSFGAPDAEAFAEVGARTWSEWASAVVHPIHVTHLANEFSELALKTLGDRTLISFFIRSPVAGEFSMWGPWAGSGLGRKLPTKVVEGDGFTVSISVSRYEEAECDVTAYEWEAKLSLAGAVQPDAAACGMIYVFEREGGVATGDLEDLIIASDSMADSDVVQVKAFITQHDDV